MSGTARMQCVCVFLMILNLHCIIIHTLPLPLTLLFPLPIPNHNPNPNPNPFHPCLLLLERLVEFYKFCVSCFYFGLHVLGEFFIFETAEAICFFEKRYADSSTLGRSGLSYLTRHGIWRGNKLMSEHGHGEEVQRFLGLHGQQFKHIQSFHIKGRNHEFSRLSRSVSTPEGATQKILPPSVKRSPRAFILSRFSACFLGMSSGGFLMCFLL